MSLVQRFSSRSWLRAQFWNARWIQNLSYLTLRMFNSMTTSRLVSLVDFSVVPAAISENSIYWEDQFLGKKFIQGADRSYKLADRKYEIVLMDYLLSIWQYVRGMQQLSCQNVPPIIELYEFRTAHYRLERLDVVSNEVSADIHYGWCELISCLAYGACSRDIILFYTKAYWKPCCHLPSMGSYVDSKAENGSLLLNWSLNTSLRIHTSIRTANWFHFYSWIPTNKTLLSISKPIKENRKWDKSTAVGIIARHQRPLAFPPSPSTLAFRSRVLSSTS